MSPKLFLPVNDANVRELMESMEEQFDPAQAVLTVCPADLDVYNSREKIENQYFYVMCGQHRLLAMKGLSRQDKLDKCKGLIEGKVPCYVCKTDSSAVAIHANIRSNDTSSKYKNTASNEDLIFVFSGLVEASGDHNEASDIVRKICISRRTAPEDTAAMMKIIGWPKDSLEKLTRVLERFKKFTTLDAKGYGTQARLKEKKPKTLTKEKFRQLGRCNPDYFAEHYDEVLSNEISLADLLKESADFNAMERTLIAASQIVGHDDIKSLKKNYPDKFEENNLKKYIGAEVYGKKKNRQGLMLKNYVKSVKEGRVVQDPIVLEEIRSVSDVGGDKLDNFDVLVYNSPKTWRPEYIKYLVDYAGSSPKSHLAVLIIFSTESHLQQVLNSKTLNFWKEDKPEFMVSQILFDKSIGRIETGVVQENLTFGVLFGKVYIFNDLVSYQRGPVESELNKVVSKVCAPSAKVAYITGGDSNMIRVHPTPPESLDKEVTYFAPKVDLDRFRQRFLVNVLVGNKVHGEHFATDGTNEEVASQVVNELSEVNISQEMTDDEDVASDASAVNTSKEDTNGDGELILKGEHGLEKQPSTSSKQYSCSHPEDLNFV